MGTSELVVVMSRPGTRWMWGSGRNRSSSTPTGTMPMRSMSTPSWAAMSRRLDCDTVTMWSSCLMTRFCILRNEYQRRSVRRFHGPLANCRSRSRSTVIGWCTVVSRGQPASWKLTMPGARHWLSCTMSNSSRRSASSFHTRLA